MSNTGASAFSDNGMSLKNPEKTEVRLLYKSCTDPLIKYLQEKLCDRFGLTVTVCHYPPGCSKWNPIEYRLFSEISKNWEGRPLRTLSIMLAYIRGTTTTAGLTVEACLDEGIYRKGQKVMREDMASLNLRLHDTCPEWNYTISPRTK